MNTGFVTLDLWGTLIKSDPRFKPARNEMLRDFFAPGSITTAFDAALRQKDREADALTMADGVDRGFRERLMATANTLSENMAFWAADEKRVQRALAAQDDLCRQFPPLPLDDRLPDLVSSLCETLPVGVVSNTGMLPGSTMRHALEAAGFGAIRDKSLIFSDEVEAEQGKGAKPYPNIFERAIARVPWSPMSPAEGLHVGDNYVADMLGARGVGMRSVQVNDGQTSTYDVLSGVLAEWR